MKYAHDEMIFALDPGNRKSGYVVVAGEGRKVIEAGVEENRALLDRLETMTAELSVLAYEEVVLYGTKFREVADTAVASGMFIDRFLRFCHGGRVWGQPAQQVRLSVCGSVYAKDPDVRRELIQYYQHNPLPKSVRTHAWSALAVAHAYLNEQEVKRKILCS